MKRTKYSSQKQVISTDHALELYSTDSFLTINKRLLQMFGPEVAVFLSNLIDKYKYFKEKGMLEDGKWFYLIHEQQIEQTGLTITKIRSCKTVLKKHEILEVRMKGIPAKEQYSLNIDCLLLVMEPIRTCYKETLGQEVRKPEGILLYKNNKNKNKKYIKKKKTIYLSLANYLYKIIQSKRNINYSPKQIEGWAEEIEKLIKSNGISTQRIKEVLKWYNKHIGKDYVPVILSGNSLRTKFLKLEDAVYRDKNPIKETDNKPNTIGHIDKTPYKYKEVEEVI